MLGSLDGSGIKLVALALCAVGIYAFARWASGLGQPGPGEVPPILPSLPASHSAGLGAAPAVAAVPDPQEVVASFPDDPELGRLRIAKFFFKKLDAVPGPPDPRVFADDLYVELYDPDTGHEWWQSYFVASPQGLDRILRNKSWDYLYAPEMIVVPRYNLEGIRRAVVSRIVASQDYFKPAEQKEEEL